MKRGCPAMVVLAVRLAALLTTTGAAALPSYTEVRAAHTPSDLQLQDRHGTPIQTLRVDAQVRRLPWVPLAELSPALVTALVLSEDQRFWQHSGIDWRAVAKSAWANTLNTQTRGASTLTMQLAGLLDEGLARPAQGRSVAQKLGQAATALQLERQWTKAQILEAYLNAVPLRGEMVGINALSQTLFGKYPSGLDAQEAALAAALVRAPNAPPERVAERACAVLRLQQRHCNGLQGLADAALARRGSMPLGEQLAPHFARQALRARETGAPRSALPHAAALHSAANPAQTLRTTLDAPLQRVALQALRHQLAELRGRNVEDGAVLVLDNATGEVLAWVGSSGSAFSDAAQVDGVLARRQPGSTLKPFVYQLAFEQRLVTPATLLDDSPAQLATAAGLYLPQNYDRSFRGWVSARAALGASLNVPAVRVVTLLPPGALHQRLNDWGLALQHTAGHYGHALALGGADVNLLALSNAYRALARGGLWSPPAVLPVTAAAPAAPGPRRVADAAASSLVTDILADNNARSGTFGLHSALATPGFAAVKTGTSKDLRDNWCVGYTSRYTVGVWVGNASGEPMHGVSGISGAAPVWQALVQHLHALQVSIAPAKDPSLLPRAVVLPAAGEPYREEWFMAGTEPPQPALPHAPKPAPILARAAFTPASHPVSPSVPSATPHPSRRAFGITSPRDGSVFALDPDIPPAAQRLTFEGEAGTWLLNGRRVGQGSTVSWSPTPGRHRLRLLSPSGHVLQEVGLEVRSLQRLPATTGG